MAKQSHRIKPQPELGLYTQAWSLLWESTIMHLRTMQRISADLRYLHGFECCLRIELEQAAATPLLRVLPRTDSRRAFATHFVLPMRCAYMTTRPDPFLRRALRFSGCPSSSVPYRRSLACIARHWRTMSQRRYERLLTYVT